MAFKFSGIDFGSLIPKLVELVRSAAAQSGWSGADKEVWVIQQLEAEIELLLDQALPMFRPFVRTALDVAVPFGVKVCWAAIFGADAGIP